MHYYVITGGPLTSEAVNVIGEGEIIAADAGIDFCMNNGIKPAFAVGDFDSVSAEALEKVRQSGIPIKTYPVEKDMTDTEIALSFIPDGNEITVVCPLTGRLDHIIANLQIAGTLHADGKEIVLDDGVTQVFFLSDNETLKTDVSRWGDDTAVSLVPMSYKESVSGVSTDGLYYPLENGTLEFGKSLSFSNKPVKSASKISVSIAKGLLAVILTRAV